MKLHILGSVGYHGNGFRETTCLAIPELGIVLDAGTGFYRLAGLVPLLPPSMPLNVFLSHGHIDHTIGLTYGITTFHNQPVQLTVNAQPRILRAMERVLFDGPLFPLPMSFMQYATREMDAEGRPDTSASVGIAGEQRLIVTATTLPHPGGSTGYRFEIPDGRHFAYITDTDARQVRTGFVAGCHTLIHECNFPDEYVELARRSGHSILSDVLRLAERARVKKLILMHFNNYPEMMSGKHSDNLVGILPPHLPCEVILSDDNMVVDLF